eukprot:COSAG01_NODE_10965_length_2038_cov_1.301702_5_plen_127_part_00
MGAAATDWQPLVKRPAHASRSDINTAFDSPTLRGFRTAVPPPPPPPPLPPPPPSVCGVAACAAAPALASSAWALLRLRIDRRDVDSVVAENEPEPPAEKEEEEEAAAGALGGGASASKKFFFSMSR